METIESEAGAQKSEDVMDVRTPQETQPTMNFAGFISRLSAFAIDAVIIAITFFGSVLMIILMAAMLSRNQPFSMNFNDLLAGFLFTFYFIFYNAFFWSITGRTPGKALLGLQVVRKSGDKIHPLRALARSFAYFVALGPVFIGFLWILIDNKRRGWHDKIAGTAVVYNPGSFTHSRFIER